MPDTTTNDTNARPAAKTYLRATLKDESTIVSEFSRLANVQRYAAQIFARVNVFNAWQLVSRTHPASGEACLVRRRRMISGEQINEIEKVVPISFDAFVATRDGMTPDDARAAYDSAIDNLDPAIFEVALDIQGTQYGTWVAPVVDTPEGAVAGMRYPVHTDATTLERFVILRVANGDTPELRYALDAGRAVTSSTIDELTGGRVVDEHEDDPSARRRRPRARPADGDEDDAAFDGIDGE